ncbi:hypothetical protein Aph02nite_69030 [Actinoplanes philippinensis]|uniref:Small secreted domain n=1 Tax=Actinoplanes philippinensis TaxID=35752 RepID=A0A1I2KQZ6_9ACTN|nr:chaplin family protein [Actinoplanes philippinensis]GIE80953.1 hypothetical protein Aph02nite_69030 [Actinoplanes philippinensis]SFF67637.1 Small secreted domain [Actinoplanes philippinensis]
MKKTWVRKTLSVGILAAGALLLAPAAMAQADIDQATFGNLGALNGNQLAMPMTVPVNVVGNSLGILGSAQSFGVGSNQVGGGSTHQMSGGNEGLLNGNQLAAPVTLPINVAGNATSLLGDSSAEGYAENRVESASAIASGLLGGIVGGVSQVSFGNFGTLNGNEVAMPISIPTSACGNSLALLGAASSYGTCGGGGGFGYVSQAVDTIVAPVRKHFVRSDNYSSCSAYVAASPCGGGGAAAYDVDVVGGYDAGVVSGYDAGCDSGCGGDVDVVAGYDAAQYVEPVAIPVDQCGNSLGMLGYASAYGTCGNYVDTGVVYSQSVQYVEPVPVVPVYTTPAYVLGGSDCVCAPAPAYGYGYGDNNVGKVHVQGPKVHKGNKGNKGPKGDVRGDQGNADKGPKGDVQGDAGYDQGSARDKDEAPADVDDAGYESPDQYGVKPGGRDEERFTATGFTRGLGALGTLDMLGNLR